MLTDEMTNALTGADTTDPGQRELVISVIRSQVTALERVLSHIEDETPLNQGVGERLRLVEKELRWLRISYANSGR